MAIISYMRLLRAGFTLSREGAFSLIPTQGLPAGAKFAISTLRLVERRSVKKTGRVERLTKALNKLGPTYVKFGQILATRPDIVGIEIAKDLSLLQDRMDPFDEKLVPKILARELEGKEKQIIDLSPAIAAASIAQVHKAKLIDKNGNEEIIAVKILRPNIREQFKKDIKSYYAGARLLEKIVPIMKRLSPVKVIEILDHSATLELDLRFEAASISEFEENIKDDEGFTLPKVKWDYIAQDVLVTSFIDAIPIRDSKAIDEAGIDRKKLGTHLMQSFLRHAIRDGFFHADMHPGNLFADANTHGIIAVDFGIMGRIAKQERKFLANIIYGFITRDYHRIAQMHIDIGYVPKNQSVDDFALALRSIG
ncbi:MAG: AarF/UbiB family protein, partial [Devosiaceae bacterium]|nr:AarF/UbiB family protein [Devosiaceae bacterium]